MKRIFRILILSLLVITGDIYAQKPPVPEREKALQLRMMEASLSELQMRLDLTESQMGQLRPVYMEYQRRVSRLNMQNHKMFNRLNTDTLSNEQAQNALRNYLDRDRKLCNLNNQYVQDLLQILSPQQVIKLYQSDSAIKRKIKNEYQRRTERPMNRPLK